MILEDTYTDINPPIMNTFFALTTISDSRSPIP